MLSKPELDRVREHLNALPIFPLPESVLLPFEMIPLHIFEPRYRELIADLLISERPLAIAQLAPGWEGDYEGRPAVEPLCGVGVLIRHESLPDGRYNILLRGVARVEIHRELPPRHAYREVQARLVDDATTKASPDKISEGLEGLRRMLFSLCAARPGPAASALSHLAARMSDPAVLADMVAAALYTDFDRRRNALVTLDPVARLEIAQSAIAELLVNGNSQEIRFPN